MTRQGQHLRTCVTGVVTEAAPTMAIGSVQGGLRVPFFHSETVGNRPARGRPTEVQGRPPPPRRAGAYSGEDVSGERGNPAGARKGGRRHKAGRGLRGRSSPEVRKAPAWRRTPVATARPARRAPGSFRGVASSQAPRLPARNGQDSERRTASRIVPSSVSP